jgi:DNA-binding IclR family transcriptional regulator
MSNTLQTVDRALRILLSFEEEGQEATVGELASLLGVHKSTASRLAATLRKHDLLERDPGSERFRLGPELARLGMLALGDRGLVEVARRPMARLAAATGETVTLGVLHGGELTTVAQIDSRHVVGPQNWVGRRTPLHATSDGKASLAFGGAKLPPGRLQRLTEQTHTRRAELERELEIVRRQGWAQALGELEHGLNGAAAPVIDVSGRCRAALSVSGPSYRVAPDDLPRLGEACRKAAGAIGSLLVGSDGAEAASGDGDGTATRARARARTGRRAMGGGRATGTAAARPG